MEAKDRRIHEFVTGKDVYFTIPSYQRKYTWDFKNEVITFLDDINSFINDDDRYHYFLGSVVIKSRPSISKNYLLVDGQQRITTFLLMIAAMRDCITNESAFKYKIKGILETEENKFKLHRIKDFDIVKKILNKNIKQLNLKDKESQYFKVYSKFLDYFKNKEKKEKNWMEKFYEKGITNIILAVIRLDENEDEFLVFESINSKGKNLSSGELIKNYVMMQLDQDKDLEKRFENDIVEQLDDKSLEDFYRQLLAQRKGDLFSKSGKKLYYAFSKEFKREHINKEFLDMLEHKLAIWKYIHETDFGFESYALTRSSVLNFYVIIATMIEKNSQFLNKDLKIKNFKNIQINLKKLTSVLIRRILYGMGRIESNRTFAKRGHEYYKGEIQSIDKLISKFENETTNSRTPSWDEVKSKLNIIDSYSNKNIIKWVLIAIEESMIKRKLDIDKISVEHIYPQNPSDDWNFDSEESEKMSRLLNTIGNLSITNINSALGNKIFEKKKQILEDRSYLKINKMIYETDEWNSKEIKLRANKIFELIKKIWS